MAILVATAAVVLLAFGLIRKQHEPVPFDPRARWILRAALLVMGAFAGFWAFFGIGEMAGGDMSGVSHLVPAVIIVLLMLAVRRRPFEGGIVLMVVGTLVTIAAWGAYRGGWGHYIRVALITGLPLLASGILLVLAARLAQAPSAPPSGGSDS
jgi:hypothetical protein